MDAVRPKRPKYILLGLSRQYYTCMVGGDSIEELEKLGESLIYYSIFANKPGLWANVQKEYLVVTKHDPLWSQVPEMSVH